MPNDDLTVGRCEALSDAAHDVLRYYSTDRRIQLLASPLESVKLQIAQAEGQAKAIQAKLDSLHALRAKLLSDPECAKAVQAALELLR